MVAQGIDSRFVGQNIVSDRGQSGPIPGKEMGWLTRKDVNVVRALVSGQSYWSYKFLRPPYLRAATELPPSDFFGTIIHFLYNVPVLQAWHGQKMRIIIETHNYDPAIFGHLAEASRNPVLRYLCRQATRFSLRQLAMLPKGTTLVHVSDSDAAAYEKHRPDLRHEVIENGCHIAPRTSAPDYAAPGPKQLMFVGSLFAQMNQDALFNFSRVQWPALRGVAKMRVVGSLPPSAVTALCIAEGWELCANVSDAELEQLYASAHFAIAPFGYGAGSKLKLMEACGRGVPMLATKAGVTGMTTVPPCVHVSDDSKDWKRIVTEWAPTPEAVRETLEFAEQVSWPRLARKLVKIIEESDVATIP
jgi:glycosyltransferase involved in cell wall biosynthesis